MDNQSNAGGAFSNRSNTTSKEPVNRATFGQPHKSVSSQVDKPHQAAPKTVPASRLILGRRTISSKYPTETPKNVVQMSRSSKAINNSKNFNDKNYFGKTKSVFQQRN